LLPEFEQVKIWDPSLRGSELRATLKGHTGYTLFLIHLDGSRELCFFLLIFHMWWFL